VTLIQLVCSGVEQNFSGWPKEGSWAAIFFHRSQPPPGRSWVLKGAGLSWLPVGAVLFNVRIDDGDAVQLQADAHDL
jgi:hypothetical protein